MGEYTFKFEEEARRRMATPRWMRHGFALGVGLCLLVLSMVFGERIKDMFYASRLAGRWVGEEVEAGGLWTREVEYDFRKDGTLDVTLRLQLEGARQPEVSTTTNRWSIRHGHLIIEAPLTGAVPVRLLHVGRREIRFGGGSKIRSFQRVESP